MALGGTLVPHDDRYGHILTPFGALALSTQPIIDAGEALYDMESTSEKERICPTGPEAAGQDTFDNDSPAPCSPNGNGEGSDQ